MSTKPEAKQEDPRATSGCRTDVLRSKGALGSQEESGGWVGAQPTGRWSARSPTQRHSRERER